MTELRDKKMLSLMGMARRAGKIIIGYPLVAESLGKKDAPYLVVYSKEASENTKKHVLSKTEYYRVERMEISVSPDEIGSALGKSGSVAVVGIKEPHIAKELIRIKSTGKEPSV